MMKNEKEKWLQLIGKIFDDDNELCKKSIERKCNMGAEEQNKKVAVWILENMPYALFDDGDDGAGDIAVKIMEKAKRIVDAILGQLEPIVMFSDEWRDRICKETAEFMDVNYWKKIIS